MKDSKFWRSAIRPSTKY